MNKIAGYTSDDIREAVKQKKKIKPEYALMLDLYEKIYIAQEESKNVIQLNDFNISDEVLSVKLKEQFPLINISQFIIDQNTSEKLFKNLCTILLEAGSELSESVQKITDLTDNKKLNPGNLFSEFLKENEAYFNKLETESQVDKAILGFLIYNSLKPSLSLFSEKISVYLNKEKEWDKGYCPVCGSMPELSTFEENGKRFLICGFCAHKWTSKRIYCPFCENNDHETIQYFEIEGEEEYRVDACDKCKTYIKTVDIKKTSRLIYLPLENQSTPYINLKFEEMGYKSGNTGQD
ncbi:MAG TPA: formate dehydrogenase accessory protein FdhE [Spirochaetota bacterium]|nr:formate dehydrogenase accessory protein FdhE [Spirochaetota bacterium]